MKTRHGWDLDDDAPPPSAQLALFVAGILGLLVVVLIVLGALGWD